MVYLKNIQRNGGTIQCKYSPENTEQYGFIKVDISTKRIVEIEYSEYPFGKDTYAGHARSKLVKLADRGSQIPQEAKAVWY